MHELINNVWKLQTLELADPPAGQPKEIAALRAQIPSQVLAHYDRLRARGKKGVSLVRNQVCTACHMQVPRGAILTLMRGEDIQLCECCGPCPQPRPMIIRNTTGAFMIPPNM